MWLCLNISISSFERIMYKGTRAPFKSAAEFKHSHVPSPPHRTTNSSELWDRKQAAGVGSLCPELCPPGRTFPSFLVETSHSSSTPADEGKLIRHLERGG